MGHTVIPFPAQLMLKHFIVYDIICEGAFMKEISL